MPSLAFRKASICSRFSFSASCTLVVNPQHATRSRLILYWKLPPPSGSSCIGKDCRLTVGQIVEYPPQRGNHPGSVGFGVASGHEWSGQTGASQPFLSNSGGPSRIHKTPSCMRDRGSRSAGLPQASGRRGRRCGMGTGGIVAGEIGRGEVRLYRFPHPDKQRPVVVLTRDSAIGYLSAVTVAPITSTIRGVPSEVLLTEKDGMKNPCAINLHNVVTVSKAHLGRRVAMLSSERLREICGALGFALGCA